MSASNPLAPDIVEACAQALARAERILDPHHLYPELATACIRAFLANWRPRVTESMLHAIDSTEEFESDSGMDLSFRRSVQNAIDTMLAEARGV